MPILVILANKILGLHTAGPPAITDTLAIADTGCTVHFFTMNMLVHNPTPSPHPISIQNPDSSVIQSMHDAELNIPGLPLAACIRHIVPALSTKPLLSIGQFCNAGCQVAFTTTMDICYNGNLVLQGMCTQHTQLWELDLQQPVCLTSQHCHLAMGHDTTADLIAFAHAALFSPALSTLAKALHHQHVPKFAGLTLA